MESRNKLNPYKFSEEEFNSPHAQFNNNSYFLELSTRLSGLNNHKGITLQEIGRCPFLN
jgi:hypothetical protein